MGCVGLIQNHKVIMSLAVWEMMAGWSPLEVGSKLVCSKLSRPRGPLHQGHSKEHPFFISFNTLSSLIDPLTGSCVDNWTTAPVSNTTSQLSEQVLLLNDCVEQPEQCNVLRHPAFTSYWVTDGALMVHLCIDGACLHYSLRNKM